MGGILVGKAEMRTYAVSMHRDIQRVLISEAEIHQRLDELAGQIMVDFADDELVVVALLKGALVFVADMVRRLPVKLSIEFMSVASYHGGKESSGSLVYFDRDLPDVAGRKVLLVDDILDTGLTLSEVMQRLLDAGAAEVKCCVLLEKKKAREVEMNADYAAFMIEDEFVVGYGLDYQGRYRNLPYVGVFGGKMG